jgi:hypothetical protein
LKLDINEIVIALKSKKQYTQRKLTINKKKRGKNKYRRNSSKLDYLSINKLININEEDLNVENIKNNDDIVKKEQQDLNTQNKSLPDKQILDYKDFELNLMEYKDAIKSDKRTYFKYLSLSQNNIIKLKQEKEKDKLVEKKQNLLNYLQIKFIIFFSITFIILLFCWYYITCFCGIYVNTQIHLLKDSLFSFIISLIYPFLTCLIPGIFRISALRDEKGSLGFIYKLSSLLMLII